MIKQLTALMTLIYFMRGSHIFNIQKKNQLGSKGDGKKSI